MTWYAPLTGVAVDRIASRLYVGTWGYPFVVRAQGGMVFAPAEGSYPRILIPADGSVVLSSSDLPNHEHLHLCSV